MTHETRADWAAAWGDGPEPATPSDDTGGRRPPIDQGSRRLGRQRMGLVVLGAAVALATVAVPPLILAGPDPRQSPGSWPAVQHQGPSRSATAAGPTPPPTLAPPSTTSQPSPSATGSVRSGVKPAPAGSTSAPPAHIMVTAEAEASTSVLTGGAQVTDCGACSGGFRVRYLGPGARLVVRTAVPAAAHRLTVVYEADGNKDIQLAINGGPATSYPVYGTSWFQPQRLDITVDLGAGPLSLTFTNDGWPAADIDAVVIT